MGHSVQYDRTPLFPPCVSPLFSSPPRPHPLLIPPRPHPLLPLPPSSPPIAACNPKKTQTAASLRVGNPIQQSPLLPHPHPALASLALRSLAPWITLRLEGVNDSKDPPTLLIIHINIPKTIPNSRFSRNSQNIRLI